MSYYMNCPLEDAIIMHLNEEEKGPKCDYCGGDLLDFFFDIEGDHICENCAEEWLRDQRREIYE